MGWRMAATRKPISRRINETRRVVWLLPEPVRTAQTETTGLVDLICVFFMPIRRKSAPAASTVRSLVHDVLVRHVAVGKHDLVDLQIWIRLYQLAFRVNRDPFRVERSGQSGRILAAFDVRDLGGGKCHHL